MKKCRFCQKTETQQWYYNLTCATCYKKEWRKNNRDRVIENKKRNYLKHKESITKFNKEYRVKNNIKHTQWRRKYEKDKRKNDIDYKIRKNLRSRLYQSIKNCNSPKSAIKDLGCTIFELKQYLQAMFTENMTWENYGKWHIDHIKPLTKFDLQNGLELSKAIHYTNLQPLWAIDNIKKGNTWAD